MSARQYVSISFLLDLGSNRCCFCDAGNLQCSLHCHFILVSGNHFRICGFGVSESNVFVLICHQCLVGVAIHTTFSALETFSRQVEKKSLDFWLVIILCNLCLNRKFFSFYVPVLDVGYSLYLDRISGLSCGKLLSSKRCRGQKKTQYRKEKRDEIWNALWCSHD